MAQHAGLLQSTQCQNLPPLCMHSHLHACAQTCMLGPTSLCMWKQPLPLISLGPQPSTTSMHVQEPLAEPGQAAEHPLASDMPSTTLYVKNLAWATTDASLLRHFDAAVSAAGGTVRSAVVQVRAHMDQLVLTAHSSL